METIAVAMSGGVDSSVAAALLAAAGHRVIGLTLNLWPEWATDEPSSRACCGVGAIEDARAVAARLGVPHYVLDMRDAFARRVIEPFAEAYARGLTPNPCVACNRAIKFDVLLARARALGADAVATGHYARAADDPATGRRLLLRARDPHKDQTYVLIHLTQDQLRRVRFPVGEFSKAQIRARARALGLATADKPDSQEICFVPSGHYADVVARLRPQALAPGPILDLDGRELGAHRGLARYTVGQRRGLGLAAGRPLYVVALDPERNAVIVGAEDALDCDELDAADANWIAGRPAGSERVTVRVRHAGAEVEAVVEPRGRGARVRFDRPVRAPSAGQAVAFYRGDVVLGGGTVARVRTRAAAAPAGR